ncbi:MAG TPA: hypothetical protein DCZ08_00355 [Anaerolineaceae bacterium]|nr:hypothetical protein [Anaerolineaceae bacterium]
MTDLATVSPTRVVISAGWQADFRAWLEMRGKSSKTVAAYGSDINRFGAWFGDVHRSNPTSCPRCSRKLFFAGNIRVYEVRG